MPSPCSDRLCQTVVLAVLFEQLHFDVVPLPSRLRSPLSLLCSPNDLPHCWLYSCFFPHLVISHKLTRKRCRRFGVDHVKDSFARFEPFSKHSRANSIWSTHASRDPRDASPTDANYSARPVRLWSKHSHDSTGIC